MIVRIIIKAIGFLLVVRNKSLKLTSKIKFKLKFVNKTTNQGKNVINNSRVKITANFNFASLVTNLIWKQNFPIVLPSQK
ncbi:MAG: hypothetical protein SPLM_02360 [Spiroplasma phoeniceum]